MTELTPTQRFSRRATDDPDFANRVASVTGIVGGSAAGIGIITGVVIALHRVAVTCSDGQINPDTGDPKCYDYPELGAGLALAMISIALLALTIMAYVAVTVVVASRHRRY